MLLLILVLSPVSDEWKGQVNSWCKLAYSHPERLCQQKWNGNLSSLPLKDPSIKENAGNCLCSCLCVCVSSVLKHCPCGRRGSLFIFFFFSKRPDMLLQQVSPSFPSLNSHYFHFSHFPISNTKVTPPIPTIPAAGGDVFAPLLPLLYPSLWIQTSRGTAWTQAQGTSACTWREKPGKTAQLCELKRVGCFSRVHSEEKSLCRSCKGLLGDQFANPAVHAPSVLLSGLPRG